ncbi:hypothetical protein MUN74_12160 [Agromyces endophyticus]|uniref:hypothetical protein n=1 Tax=Agromyces sp. H17E-10 TaxID=2932244 RepID=UPI001FD5792F|nr:hypothetical protein [Agromyces sp. H17E-10]UOQ88046.1 hypothetical protein MUN74_12160 [Agromyces sp. H17E-10]
MSEHNSAGSSSARPWYLRWWVILIGIALIIWAINGLLNPGGSADPEPATDSNSEVQPPPAEQFPDPPSTAAAEENESPEPPRPDADALTATSTGLTATYAQAACDAAITDYLYPDAWNPAWVLGKLAEQIEDDRWFLKVEGEVESAAGGELQVNAECYVSGTNEAPVVDTVNVY